MNRSFSFSLNLGNRYFLAILAIGLAVGGWAGYTRWNRPHTTADQKLGVRTVQLNFSNAQTALNSSPQYKACLDLPACKDFLQSPVLGNYIDAQTKLQNSVQAVFSAAKADPTKYELSPELEFVDIPKSVLNPPAGPKPSPATPAQNGAATTTGPNSPAVTGNGNTVSAPPAKKSPLDGPVKN